MRTRFIKLNKSLAKYIVEDKYPYLQKRIELQLAVIWNDMTEGDREFIRGWYAQS